MPSKNTVKQFDAEAMYHVYNRGVEKRAIFLDEQDYAVFLSFLKYALLSSEQKKALEVVDSSVLSEAMQFNLRRLGLANRLDLVSYCLMPNHFHLLFYQYDKEAITAMMRSISTGYVMYFNHRYKRSGRLFQGTYKAVHVDKDSYWSHISRYIHLNPIDIGSDYRTYEYSSYKYYMGLADAEWVQPGMGLNGLSRRQYDTFLADWVPHRKDIEHLKRYLADK